MKNRWKLLIGAFLIVIFALSFVNIKADDIYESCTEANAKGQTNIRSTDIRYNPKLDKNHDGREC